MSSAAIPQDAALKLQLAAIGGNEPPTSMLEIRPLGRDGRPAVRERSFIPVRELERAAQRIVELSPDFNVYVGAAPRVREDGTAAAVERVWTLWADCDGGEALERLRAFRPRPSVVIRTGSDDSAHAYWPLSSPLTPTWAQRANRRLALALLADGKSTDPARILRPAGTLSHKYDPARPVVCTRLELDVFTLDEVVGPLPDDPRYLPTPRPVREARASDPTNVVDGLVRTVRTAEVGNRNCALFWAACRVRERAELDELDGNQASELLRQAALEAGLTEHETDRTLGSALEARAAA
jgi:hypothetical protein